MIWAGKILNGFAWFKKALQVADKSDQKMVILLPSQQTRTRINNFLNQISWPEKKKKIGIGKAVTHQFNHFVIISKRLKFILACLYVNLSKEKRLLENLYVHTYCISLTDSFSMSFSKCRDFWIVIQKYYFFSW